MIWNPGKDTALSQAAEWISAEMDAVCEKELVVDSDDMEELGKAIDFFLDERDEPAGIDGKYMVMLASRALSSIGKDEAARRLLVFGTGLVKPAEWEVTGDETVWVLDLKKITVREDGPLEMAFFNSLLIVLECVADAWDEHSGEGVLGLSHVCSTAAEILGATNDEGITALSGEIMRICRGKMERISRERRWRQLPRVMNLDF